MLPFSSHNQFRQNIGSPTIVNIQPLSVPGSVLLQLCIFRVILIINNVLSADTSSFSKPIGWETLVHGLLISLYYRTFPEIILLWSSGSYRYANSVEWNLSWKAENHSSAQNIPASFRSQRFHHYSFLSQMNPIHMLTPCLCCISIRQTYFISWCAILNSH